MQVKDFQKASLHQLMVILRHDEDEDCLTIYKCNAESEFIRRMEGTSFEGRLIL